MVYNVYISKKWYRLCNECGDKRYIYCTHLDGDGNEI